MSQNDPAALLYLLSVGKEKELILRLHGTPPSTEQLLTWMERGSVVTLEVSHPGEPDTFRYVINFSHVVGARLSPYTTARLSTF